MVVVEVDCAAGMGATGSTLLSWVMVVVVDFGSEAQPPRRTTLAAQRLRRRMEQIFIG